MLKNYNFIKNKKIAFSILAAIVIIGVASFFIKGFVIDIDFSGGSELQVNMGTEVTDDICNKINDVISDSVGHEYVSSTLASTADSKVAIIRTGTKDLNLEQQKTLKAALSKAFPDIDFGDLQFNSISATIGEDLKKTAIISVLVSLVFIMVYIWIRFELVSGVAAFICLIHDIFVMMMFYSLLQIPVNSNIIATLLTIVGYSLNATIIVFDRVRENRKFFGDSKSFADTVDLSIHQTLTRSINTTTTTLITAVAVYIFGVDSIRNFALPLIVGIVAGLFSSIFLAGLLWVEGNKVFKKNEKAVKPVKAVNTSK